MRSQIELSLDSLSTAELSFDNLSVMSQFPLKEASAVKTILPEGSVLIQAISHYIVHVQLYEYCISSHCLIDIEITEPAFFMIVMLEGCSVLYDENNNAVSEISGNACKLTYLPAGKYQRTLLSGCHQILVLTIRPEWLINKYGPQEELQALITHYHQNNGKPLALPCFAIGQQVFNGLTKLKNGTDTDIDIHIFINDCLGRYLHKLQARNNNIEYQENKAKEIRHFLIHNFASKIADDEPALARHFMISTITLIRLAKQHFGLPLHKHVIELRLLNALKMLLATKKTIQEIAANVGYDDPHYFSRAFKKRFGVPPHAVRLSVF